MGDGEIEKVGEVKGQKEVEGQTREKGGKGMCEEEEGGGGRCQSDTIVTGTSVVMPVGGHHRLSILSHHPSAPKWKVSPAHTTPQWRSHKYGGVKGEVGNHSVSNVANICI